jgi:adenylate kinase family enzyme
MRIMIIGAAATGKSTFGEKLSKKLSIHLVHIDEIVNNAGRDKIAGELIRKEADKPNWIIDGNSFTRDRNYRIEKADYIFLFTANRFKSLAAHIGRWFKERKIEKITHGRSKGLHLGFILSFTLWRWPKREKEILEYAQSLNKKVIFIKNHKEADLHITQLTRWN